MIPTIGRIVIYVDFDRTEHPAIVLAREPHPWDGRVLRDDEIAIEVIKYGQGRSHGVFGVPQDELPPLDKIGLGERSTYETNTWHWPVRQES